jgi:serine phosphatase RsbU (regulator of sigma subunit)
MVFLTDGIAEARNKARQALGYEAILDCLRQIGNDAPRNIGNCLIDTMNRHCKDIPVEDDVSILIIKRRPS